MADTQIRVQELNGLWTVIGAGKAQGITLSDGSAIADQWGSQQLQFTLKRNPRSIWPDIGAFTPVEVEVGGVLVWSGRVKETPTRDGDDRQMTVTCEGWQYHLDDDVYQRMYVETDLSQFVDSRSLAACDLIHCRQGAQLVMGQGIISVGWSAGYTVFGQEFASLTYDCGANSAVDIQTVFYQYTAPAGSDNDGTVYGYMRGSNDPNPVNNPVTDFAFTLPAYLGSTGNYQGGNLASPCRYLHFFTYYAGGTPGVAVGAFSEDQVLQIPKISIASDPAYVSHSVPYDSVLTADVVVKDAIARATLLLSSDVSKIAAGTFYVPQFSLSGMTTPRDVINAVNIYENYQPRVLVDKRVEYRQKPQDTGVIAYQVDEDPVFEDASANSGENIYSGVVVQATGPDGLPLQVTRIQTVGAALSGVQPSNPGAEVNTTGWSVNTGSLVRDTTQHDTGVGSFKATIQSLLSTSSWTGTFVVGHAYTLTLSARLDFTYTGLIMVSVVDANGTTLGSQTINLGGVSGGWSPYSIAFTPLTSGAPSVVVQAVGFVGSGNYWVDSLILNEATPTIIQKRNFKRTYVLNTNMALTSAAAQQIGDKFLDQHQTTPLKGSLSISGNRGVKRAQGGNAVPAYELLTNTGEQIIFPHLTDPDTGAVGRTGVIDTVTYNLITGEASVAIDSTRGNFEKLLARLQVVTGLVH